MRRIWGDPIHPLPPLRTRTATPSVPRETVARAPSIAKSPEDAVFDKLWYVATAAEDQGNRNDPINTRMSHPTPRPAAPCRA